MPIRKILHINPGRPMLPDAIEQLAIINYEYEYVVSPETAFQKLRQYFEYVIILDIDSKEYEPLKIIAELRNLSDAPIIIECSNINSDMIDKCISKGACDFIRSPLLPVELRLKILTLHNYSQTKGLDKELQSVKSWGELRNKISGTFLNENGEQLFSAVEDIMKQHYMAEHCLLGYLDNSEQIIFPASIGQSKDCSLDYQPDKGIDLTNKCLGQKRTIVLNDGPVDICPELELNNTIALPLTVANNIIGILILGNKNGGFSARDKFNLEELSYLLAPLLSAKLNSFYYETDLLETKAKAEFNEKILSTVFNSVRDGIILIEVISLDVYMANNAMCKMLGYTKDELIRMKVMDLHPGEALHNIMDTIVGQINRKFQLAENIPVKRKDGSIFYCDVNSSPVTINGMKYLTGVFRDISLKLKTEEALKESENLLKEAGRLAKLGGWKIDIASSELTWTDEIYNIHEVTKAYKPSVETAIDFYTPDSQEKIKKAVDEARNKGLSYDLELSLVTAKGNFKYVRAIGHAASGKDGKVITVYGIFQDITNEKQKNIQYQMLSNVVDQSPFYILITDLTGNIEYVNPAFTEITGYRPEEIIGQNPRVLQSGLMDRKIFEELWETLQRGEIWRGEFINKRKNGAILYERVVIAPFKDESGKIRRYFAIKEDYTRQKQTERKLVESAGIIKATLDSTNNMFLLFDRNNNILLFNKPAFYIIKSKFGIDLKEGDNVEVIHSLPMDWKKFSNNMDRGFNNERTEYTRSVTAGDGDTRWFKVVFQPVAYSDEEVFAVSLTMTDVTEIILGEIERNEYINKLKATLDSTNDNFLLLDREFKILAFNKTANNNSLAVLGKNLAQGLPVAEYIPTEDYQQFINQIDKAFNGNKQESEKVKVTPDGKTVWLSTKYMPAYNERDEIFAVSYISSDITERKTAEQELKNSEERYRQLIKSARTAIIKLDNKGFIRFFNEYAIEIFEFSEDEIVGRHVLDTIVPRIDSMDQDLEAMVNMFISGLGRHYNEIQENENITKSGRRLWMAWLNKAITDENNNIVEIISSGTDITARRKAEEALLRSEAKLKEAQQIAQLGNWTLDLLTGTLYWSDGIYEIFDLDKEEFEPSYQTFLEHIHPDDREKVNKAYNESLGSGQPYEIVHRLKLKDGKIKYVREIAKTEYDSNSKPIKSIGVVQDITARHLMNIELENTVEQKDVLLKEIHHRVKNNLQTIRSLLFKQQRASDIPEVRSTLQDSIDRIASMALIHEQIYSSKDISKVNFAKYIKDFASRLLQTYRTPGKEILLKMDTEEIFMQLDNAIPCALIVNEIISNSLKYAFPDKTQGLIIVKLKKMEGHRISLTIADDGIGLPDGLNIDNLKSLGMFIIHNISTRQLRGQLNINSDNGTEYQIIFKN